MDAPVIAPNHRKLGKRDAQLMLERVATPHSRALMLEKLSKKVHRYEIGKMVHLGHSAQKSVSRLHAALKSAKEIDFRKKDLHVSNGGHIGRANLDPLSDHFKLLKPPRYQYPPATLPTETTIQNPDWDPRFIHQKSLYHPPEYTAPAAIETSTTSSVNDYEFVIEKALGISIFHGGKSSPSLNPLKRRGSMDSNASMGSQNSHQSSHRHAHTLRGPEFLHSTYLFLPKQKRKELLPSTDSPISMATPTPFNDRLSSPKGNHLSLSSPFRREYSNGDRPYGSAPSEPRVWEGGDDRPGTTGSTSRLLNPIGSPPIGSGRRPAASDTPRDADGLSTGRDTVDTSRISYIEIPSELILHPHLSNNLEIFWDTQINALSFASKSIGRSELTEISKLRQPPPMLIAIVGYFCLLAGTDATWNAAKKSLLHDVGLFQKFLIKVDVFNVPAICIRNAAEFKAAFMLNWKPTEASILSKPAAKLLSWITSFNIMACGALDVIHYLVDTGGFEDRDVANLTLSEFLEENNEKDSLFINLLESGQRYEFKSLFWTEFRKKYRVHHRAGEIDALEDDDDSVTSNYSSVDTVAVNKSLQEARKDVQALLRKAAKQRRRGQRKLEWNRGGESLVSGKFRAILNGSESIKLTGRSGSTSSRQRTKSTRTVEIVDPKEPKEPENVEPGIDPGDGRELNASANSVTFVGRAESESDWDSDVSIGLKRSLENVPSDADC